MLLLLAAWFVFGQAKSALHQASLEAFYSTEGLTAQGELGGVVKKEPLGVKLKNGDAYRILYRTQRSDGSYTFSSGRVFIPHNDKSGAPRPVLAWAHGTLGLGDKCTPSRALNPISNFEWVDDMLAKGWVVTATDYAGFGTPGTQGYLVGGSEAKDVLNSVRAVRNLPESKADSRFAVWGHSQGGHSALFTATLTGDYAPELKLVSTVASAPAAELVALLDEQYGTTVDWVIGPIIAATWPAFNNQLMASDIIKPAYMNKYQHIANECIEQSGIEGLLRNGLGQRLFSQNPIDLPQWHQMATSQTAPSLEPDQPLLVVESKDDKVVLPDTTALYIERACAAGSQLDMLWLDKAGHNVIPAKSSTQVIEWLSDRFAGKQLQSDCGQPLPVKPAS